MNKLLFEIEWLKTYAFTNKLTWKFQVAQTPVSKKFFMDINETTQLGFTIEEAKTLNDETCLTRHMSIVFQSDVEGVNFDFYLQKFDFDIELSITSYRQQSKYGGILVHFIQIIK
jgi:hypothetical protein